MQKETYREQAKAIFDRIGDGHLNGIERPWNRAIDRSLRKFIEDANNNGDCIISGATGYYRPIPSDLIDAGEYNIYMAQERRRIDSLLLKEECMKTAYRSRRLACERKQ